jgi:hypothetical protein
MQAQRILAIISVAVQVLPSLASWANIAGYEPGSKVTSHNAIDLDQKAIEIALGATSIDYTLVQNIYSNGGNSKPYAEFTVPALTSALSKGDAVVGVTSSTSGKMYSSYSTGVTSIKVAYAISDTQASYASCKVGALSAVPGGTTAAATQPYQLLTGCFQTENLSITTGGSTVTVVPTGVTNKAGRTLKGFSIKAGATMYTIGTNGGCDGASDRSTDGCPYLDFSMYYNYYGNMDYADKFVSAAIGGTATGFAKSAGNMDFTGASDTTRIQLIKKGTAYMNAYMYAIREFEDAIDDCNAGCANGINGAGANCNGLSLAAVHAWDEGVAFYTGSREGAAVGGSTNGVMSYRLAEKRCVNFKTCGANYNSVSGVSYVNTELFRQFSIGNNKILSGDCAGTLPVVRKIVALMATPLIQGTLRYAYKVGVLNEGEKSKAEGAVFAASIVPRVAYCNTADAATIMNNMKIGATSTSFTAVKTAFENNYACMNITCAEVGGLWFSANNAYYTDACPCGMTCTSGTTGTTGTTGTAATTNTDTSATSSLMLSLAAFCLFPLSGLILGS